jgi:hypothetical protein
MMLGERPASLACVGGRGPQKENGVSEKKEREWCAESLAPGPMLLGLLENDRLCTC